VKIQEGPLDDDITNERNILALLERLLGVAEDSERTQYTLMNFYPGKNLLSVLYERDFSKPSHVAAHFVKKEPLDIFLKARLVSQIIQQVLDMQGFGKHPHDILLHRDIKTDNFVLDKRGEFLVRALKLSLVDMGLALRLDDPNHNVPAVIYGTYGYVAPERCDFTEKKDNSKDKEAQEDKDDPKFKPMPYGIAQDYFSLGIVLAEILTDLNYQARLLERLPFFPSPKMHHLKYQDFRNLLADAFNTEPVLPMPTIRAQALQTCQSEMRTAIKNLITELTWEDPTLRLSPEKVKKKGGLKKEKDKKKLDLKKEKEKEKEKIKKKLGLKEKLLEFNSLLFRLKTEYDKTLEMDDSDTVKQLRERATPEKAAADAEARAKTPPRHRRAKSVIIPSSDRLVAASPKSPRAASPRERKDEAHPNKAQLTRSTSTSFRELTSRFENATLESSPNNGENGGPPLLFSARSLRRSATMTSSRSVARETEALQESTPPRNANNPQS